MRDGCLEGRGMVFESQTDHGGIEDEQHDVEEEENQADGVETWKSVWHCHTSVRGQ